MYSLPQSVFLRNEEFGIRSNGDYRVILDCFKALEDTELTKQERLVACLIMFYEGVDNLYDINRLPDLEQAVKEMYNFFNCGQKDSPGIHSNYKLIDWEADESLIVSAINNVAHAEIRSTPYIHWWTFMGYYTAIGDSPLSNIVGIRSKIMKGKKLEKYEREFRHDNPQYFRWNHDTVEQKEAEEWVSKVWNAS